MNNQYHGMEYGQQDVRRAAGTLPDPEKIPKTQKNQKIRKAGFLNLPRPWFFLTLLSHRSVRQNLTDRNQTDRNRTAGPDRTRTGPGPE